MNISTDWIHLEKDKHLGTWHVLNDIDIDHIETQNCSLNSSKSACSSADIQTHHSVHLEDVPMSAVTQD